jgi:DinB superfamily
MTMRNALKSQYHAALAMLQEAIESCPPGLWADDGAVNPFWRVAYHALFYTDFYLQPSEHGFVPWEGHRPGLQRFGTDPPPDAPRPPYSIEELAGYCRRLGDGIDAAVDGLDLDAAESGFSWYPMSKLEHQLVNIRHLQHHAGQLADRLRRTGGRGVDWVGGRDDE